MDTHDSPNSPAAPTQAPPAPKVRLRGGPNGPELPLMANFVALDATANTAYLNFGFVEPEVLARLQAQAQGRPATGAQVEGRMVTRVALPLDTVALLHHQTTAYLQSLQDQVGSVLATLAKNAKDTRDGKAGGADGAA